MKYLGIDFGAKRIGLAITDDSGVLSFPYRIIQNNKELLDTIHNICGEEDIGGIVIGESLDLFGKQNKIMKEINKFKINLKKEVELPIYFEKEFMTTVFAREKIFKQKENIARKIKKEKSAPADASAAALILQRFIDRKNKK